jgi:hypothetical protein
MSLFGIFEFLERICWFSWFCIKNLPWETSKESRHWIDWEKYHQENTWTL